MEFGIEKCVMLIIGNDAISYIKESFRKKTDQF